MAPTDAYIADVTAEDMPERPTALVVDDDEAITRLFRRVLDRSGVDVAVAQSGQEARRILDSQPIDVIVSDINMPQMGGIDLLREVRLRDRELPVVLVTGAPAVSTAVEAVALGALRYLQKPVDPRELAEVVLEAARLRQLARLEHEARRRTRPLPVVDPGLARAFDSAIAGLWMAYQPIVSWRDRRVVAFEALCRTEETRFPHPGALFDAAKGLRRTFDLGRAIRRSAVSAAAELPEHAALFLNLLPTDLLDEDLYAEDSPLTRFADRVVLEITERSSLDDINGLDARIAHLRRLGFRIAVDDLGAGYSSLSTFAQLVPDVVKLDMSLVRDADREPIKQRLISSMVSVCRDMGAQVVAEGIETAAERDAVFGAGCEWMQGYLFARPARTITLPALS